MEWSGMEREWRVSDITWLKRHPTMDQSNRVSATVSMNRDRTGVAAAASATAVATTPIGRATNVGEWATLVTRHSRPWVRLERHVAGGESSECGSARSSEWWSFVVIESKPLGRLGR